MTFTVKLTAENEGLTQTNKDLELKISAITAGNKSLKQQLKDAVCVIIITVHLYIATLCM